MSLPLPATVRPEDIVGVRLETTFGGGMGGDNWNLDRLVVRVDWAGRMTEILNKRGTPSSDSRAASASGSSDGRSNASD